METQYEAPTQDPRQFAVIAERWWTTYRPSETAAIPPEQREAFFLAKGQEVADAVEYLAEDNERAGRRASRETPQERLRREGMALRRAMDEALRELVLDLPKEPGTEDRETPVSPALLR